MRRSFFDEDNNEIKRIDYQGEFLFVDGKLDKIFTEGGYFRPTAVTKTKKSDFGTYYYTLKDHLGHIRVVVDEEENVIQETAYYPYGGIIAGLSTKTNYNYLYTGKEFIDSLGVNWYDHHARYYDPEVGRWFAIDPALQAASPYMAMGNNPMIYIDADGRTWDIFKPIAKALDWAWDTANQFAQWAQQNGLPSFNVGYGVNSQGQIQPTGNINGTPLFINEAQYEAAAQNAVDAMNDARGEYFSGQKQNGAYEQRMTHKVLQITLQQQQYNNSSQIDNTRIPAWAIAAITATEPVAYSLEVTGATEVGMAGSMSPWGGIFITRGPDRFTYNNFVSGGLGVGWFSVSLMGVANKYYYWGNINNFDMNTFDGWGNNVSGSANVVLSIGGNISWVENPYAKGEYLIGVGVGGGVGVGPTIFSGQYTRQYTHIIK